MADNRASNEMIMWATVGGLVAFTIFMFYIVVKNPPWAGVTSSAGNTGAGPQPTSTDSGS